MPDEVCPCCGRFVDALLEVTGWCATCSYEHGRPCITCSEWRPFGAFSKDRTRKDGRRVVCRDCDARQRRARTTRAA